MNYIEFTETYLSKFDETENIAVLGPGYTISRSNVQTNKPGEDIVNFCNRIKETSPVKLFDAVMLSRVLEHIPFRNVDWYLYNISTIMKFGAELSIVVPQMDLVTQKIQSIIDHEDLDFFAFQRMNIELFSEGDNVFDRHSFYTTQKTVRYILQKEGLFAIEKVTNVYIDTHEKPPELWVVAKRI